MTCVVGGPATGCLLSRTGGGRTISRRNWLRLIAGVSTIVVTWVLAAPVGPYLDAAGRALSHPHLGWLALATAAELVSLGALSELRRTTLRAGGVRVAPLRMLRLTLEANSLSGSLPAGSALAAGYTFRRFRSWGSSSAAAGWTVIVTGLLSILAFGALATLAAAVAGGRSTGLLPAISAAILLLTLLVVERWLRGRPATVRRLLERVVLLVDRLRRRPVGTSRTRVLALFTDTTTIRPTAFTWASAFLFASLNWAADIVCLLAAGRAVGAGTAHMDVAVLAYVAGVSVSGLSIAPGGLGVVEATMILVISQAGTPRPVAAASVLLYRLVSYVLMMAIGWSVWVIGRRRAGRVEGPDDDGVAPLTPGTVGQELSAAAR